MADLKYWVVYMWLVMFDQQVIKLLQLIDCFEMGLPCTTGYHYMKNTHILSIPCLHYMLPVLSDHFTEVLHSNPAYYASSIADTVCTKIFLSKKCCDL